jgi:hypothetical protein
MFGRRRSKEGGAEVSRFVCWHGGAGWRVAFNASAVLCFTPGVSYAVPSGGSYCLFDESGLSKAAWMDEAGSNC